jgi:hypothetical protein
MVGMRRTLCIVAAVLVLGVTAVAASPVFNPRFNASPGRFTMGEAVEIILVNEGTTDITMGSTWDLSYVDGEGTAFYQWPDDRLVLEPGETRVWRWDQHVNACYGECQNPYEGDPAEPGRYEVTTTVDGEEQRLGFYLGEYFTIDFRNLDEEEFTVFVASSPEIEQMAAEAGKRKRDRRLIVSGIVQKKRAYNANWKFSMDPGSIELGEVFIEVCDASPRYVQRHRDEWLGERWCPWSSYVKRSGR